MDNREEIAENLSQDYRALKASLKKLIDEFEDKHPYLELKGFNIFSIDTLYPNTKNAKIIEIEFGLFAK